jgi:hypothetical protein
MTGRYAFVQDSPSTCLEGLRRLAVALEAMGQTPPRVYLLDDRDSEILGRAAAAILGVPAVPWRHDEEGKGASEEPGLLVAYDLATLGPAVLSSFYDHRPGQILFAHATCWTEAAPFTAELTTFLYQTNHSPWGERLGIDPETRTATTTAPRQDSPEQLAQEVLEAKLDDDALSPDDLLALRRLAEAAGKMPSGAGTTPQTSGLRRKHWLQSPVRSNRFL